MGIWPWLSDNMNKWWRGFQRVGAQARKSIGEIVSIPGALFGSNVVRVW